jgi:hypothetical protein
MKATFNGGRTMTPTDSSAVVHPSAYVADTVYTFDPPGLTVKVGPEAPVDQSNVVEGCGGVKEAVSTAVPSMQMVVSEEAVSAGTTGARRVNSMDRVQFASLTSTTAAPPGKPPMRMGLFGLETKALPYGVPSTVVMTVHGPVEPVGSRVTWISPSLPKHVGFVDVALTSKAGETTT